MTPGHTVSSGVPRVRKILNSWSISESPGNKALLVICAKTDRRLSLLVRHYASPTRQLRIFTVDRGVTEETQEHYHFSKDASQTPDVNSCGVVLTTQEDFRCSVPKSDHLGNITDISLKSEHCNYQRNRSQSRENTNQSNCFLGLGAKVSYQMKFSTLN